MNLALSNIGIWCLQVAIVIAVGAALPYAFRLTAPKPRLIYWHLLLAACIALPLMQPYRAAQVLVRSDVSFTTGPMVFKDAPPSMWPSLSIAEIGAGILLAGFALRLMWLGVGLMRLGRYRRSARLLVPLPDEARRVIGRLGVTANFLVSDDIHSPVTFGVRNPAILLPAGFLELPPEKREPVICHELLHIQRNDWLFAIGEELVRCALWFHPAVWWLLGRIQLTREQVVDQAVIEYTNATDDYVDALLAIAATRIEADLAPAPLFLKKRHLRQRVASIVGGVSMSKRNLLLSSIAVFSSLPLVVGIAAWQFPLNAAPQEVQDAAGVEVVGGYYKILHRTAIAYPVDAQQRGVSGGVVVSVSVNPKGEVTDAKVVSGDPEFRKVVLSSVLNWHFATEPWNVNGASKPVPPSFEIAVRFNATQTPLPAAKGTPRQGGPAPNITLERVDLSPLSPALRDRVSQLNLPREGELLTPERLAQLVDDVRSVDEHLTISVPHKDGKSVVRVFLPATGVTNGGAPSPSIRVGGNRAAENLVTKVTPIYPPEAKAARVQGVVRFNATIDKEGKIVNLELLSGHPLLVPSATDAVKQWVYRPTLLNGEPVDVITQIDVNYTLAP